MAPAAWSSWRSFQRASSPRDGNHPSTVRSPLALYLWTRSPAHRHLDPYPMLRPGELSKDRLDIRGRFGQPGPRMRNENEVWLRGGYAVLDLRDAVNKRLQLLARSEIPRR